MSAAISFWSRTSPRERLMLGGLAFAVVVFFLFIAVSQVGTSLSEIEEQNLENGEALRFIQRNAEKLRDAQRDEAARERRFARKAPALQGWLEGIATKRSLEIPEAQDKPEVNVGKNFTERSVEIRLRKIGLRPLTEFMVDVENSPYPVAVTKLHVRRRVGESDQFDVEMTVSAYDWLLADKATKALKPGARVTPAASKLRSPLKLPSTPGGP
jgi:hypothetical protein